MTKSNNNSEGNKNQTTIQEMFKLQLKNLKLDVEFFEQEGAMLLAQEILFHPEQQKDWLKDMGYMLEVLADKEIIEEDGNQFKIMLVSLTSVNHVVNIDYDSDSNVCSIQEIIPLKNKVILKTRHAKNFITKTIINLIDENNKKLTIDDLGMMSTLSWLNGEGETYLKKLVFKSNYEESVNEFNQTLEEKLTETEIDEMNVSIFEHILGLFSIYCTNTKYDFLSEMDLSEMSDTSSKENETKYDLTNESLFNAKPTILQ